MGTVAMASWSPGPGAGSSQTHPVPDVTGLQLHRFIGNTPFWVELIETKRKSIGKPAIGLRE